MWVTNALFLNAAAAGDKMSVSFWQKLHAVAASSAFWMRSPSSSGTQRGYQVHSPWSDSNIYFDSAGCCDAGTHRISANISTLPGYDEATWNWNDWHHFAIVKNGSTKQVWIDGTLLVSGSSGNPLPSDLDALMLGAEPPNAINSMQGYLDDFAVFGSALTAAQIAELAGGKSPTEIQGGEVPRPTLGIARTGAAITINFTGTSSHLIPCSPGAGQPSPTRPTHTR